MEMFGTEFLSANGTGYFRHA